MRLPRERSESGVYHVIIRGINRQDIFLDDEDYLRFLETINRMKSEGQFAVYGYCLMTNHVHLLIQEKTDNISRIMSRIGTSYAWWYNQKYGRSGHVFQDRFRSECVESDAYLLTVIRYIHNNPVKAGMVENPEEYRWSSIRAYYGNGEETHGLSKPSFILKILDPEKDEAIQLFREFMKLENKDKCLEDESRPRKTDNEIKIEIERFMKGDPIGLLQVIPKGQRNEILRKIKAEEGVSLRQISRVTGLSVDIIFNA